MNIVDKTDEEILAIAGPLWRELVKSSNDGKYGEFARNFSSSLALAMDQVVAGLPAMRASLEQLSSETWVDGVTSRELEDVARQWRRSDDRLADWARIVTRRGSIE